MPNIPRSKIRKYIDQQKPELREYLATVICDGEAFINSFEDPKVRPVLDVISEQIYMEFEKLLALVKDGKFIESEELRRIQKHCIAINATLRTLALWGDKLDTFEKHIEKL